ncbi:MAG: MBL fold metallo-hydrolase [Acidobacteriota bacterium]
MWRLLVGGVLLIAGGATTAVSAQGFDQVAIRTVPVSDGIAMLEGAGGNIGVSYGVDGVLVIDDQFAPLAEKIKAALGELSAAPVRFVLNTHWHHDHTGGNEILGGEGAVIVAHENARRRLTTTQFVKGFDRDYPPYSRAGLPVVTFTRDITFHLNDDEIHVFHVADAHTDGDAVVHFRQANVLHAGDLFFNGFYPFLDVWNGGTIDGLIAAVERLLELSDGATRIIPGHGPLAKRPDLVKYRDMLRTVRHRVAARRAAGESLEQIIAARPTADLDPTWGQGPLSVDLFLSLVYETLDAP